MFLQIALIFGACLVLVGRFYSSSMAVTSYPVTSAIFVEDAEEDYNGSDPYLPHLRAIFTSEPGARVRGWPSKGGIYIFQATNGVELDFLQINRFHDTIRSQNPVEEEAHCDRMRKLGATWWQGMEDYYKDKFTSPSPYKPVLVVGWPANGGVWVLKTTRTESGTSGVGRIFNAYNMEERCYAIEQLGGTFYADPKDCPDLSL
ncbi:hypothetical protein F5884DRAFT_786582 [Xylogone sp. PMI_703]|nr:hypothetical protein F5884DRAFT_786582 [Xylogone sp. PMI_703]